MPLTLAQADLYSTNQVLVGVAETSMDQSPLMGIMPFVPIRGNALQYQRELAAGLPTFIAPGGTVVEATPTTSQITAALKILIGDADIDKFLAVTRSKDQDLVAELMTIKARNFADTWADKLIYGSIDADANEFDGLHEIISDDVTGQQVNAGAGAVGAPGSFTLLDRLIDLVRPRPDVIIMNRNQKRRIQKLARSQGWDLALAPLPGAININVRFYNEIPILIDDFLTQTEAIAAGAFSAKTGGATATIFAARLAEDGLFGITADDPQATDDLERIIQMEMVGTLEAKDANRIRLKAYTAMVLKASQALARLDGLTDADWTN